MTTLIISSEYHKNSPSVFLFNNGNYFGCQIYPRFNEYPQDVNFWKNATGSDTGRFFSIYNVEIDEKLITHIENLQNVVDANERIQKKYSNWEKSPSYSIKRGSKYQFFLDWTEKRNTEFKAIEAYNEPFEKARYKAYLELRNILLSLKK